MQTKFRNAITILFFASFLVAFSAIGVYRYNIGQVFYYDFGIFAHIIWQLSRFQIPVINHLVLGKIVFLGDHFNPGLALLAPLFWITSDLRILLIEQAAALVASGFLLYKIAQKLGLRYSTCLIGAIVYMLFAGTENPLVTDWHPELTAAFLVLLFYYFLAFTNREKTTFVALVLFLSLKESNAMSILALFIFAFTILQEKRRSIAVMFAFSILYFLFAVKIAIPYFAHQSYIYSPNIPYSPLKIAQNFVNSESKIRLMNNSLLSFGYLPLISGVGLIPIITELAQRLVPNTTIFNNISLGQHYNVLLGVYLALATTYGIKNIQKWTKNNAFPEYAFSLYVLLISFYVARKITGSPINLAVNKTFWHELNPRSSLFNALRVVPKSGSVMAQNNILPYLVNRTDEAFLTTMNYEGKSPKVVVLDLSESQNINNFYGTDKQVVIDVMGKLEKDPKYNNVFTGNKYIYLYVKK